jgi:hypothetical protein
MFICRFYRTHGITSTHDFLQSYPYGLKLRTTPKFYKCMLDFQIFISRSLADSKKKA